MSALAWLQGVIVSLVNPRFTNFNKPLLLACLVAVFSVLCFLPVLAWNLMAETQVESDNNAYEVALVTGNMFELKDFMKGYAKLPERCTAGSASRLTHFIGKGLFVSEDGLTRTERTCHYETIPQGWCKVAVLPKAYRWLDACCSGMSAGCSADTDFWGDSFWRSLLCMRDRASYVDYYDSMVELQPSGPNISDFYMCLGSTSKYMGYEQNAEIKKCMDTSDLDNRIASGWQAGEPDLQGGLKDIKMVMGNVLTLRLGWTKNERIVTYSKTPRLTAFGNSLAYTAYIEVVVTVVLILLLRGLGILKQTASVSWGEIMSEVHNSQKADEESEARLRAELQAELEKLRSEHMALAAASAKATAVTATASPCPTATPKVRVKVKDAKDLRTAGDPDLPHQPGEV